MAISRQTPLLNTKRLLFHRLVCRRTASESHRHKRNPWIKPSSRCFTCFASHRQNCVIAECLCEPDERKKESNHGLTSVCTPILDAHVKSPGAGVQINF